MNDNGTLLSVKNLSTHFFTEQGLAKAVQDVSFSVKTGQTLALVGESGCGKSATALSIMRLLPTPQGEIVGGEVLFEGKNKDRWRGRTPTNKLVFVSSEANLLGKPNLWSSPGLDPGRCKEVYHPARIISSSIVESYCHP